MAASAVVFPKVFAAAFNKEIDLLDDTIKLLLCTSTASPDQDAWDYHNDITNEVSGTGYTAGGAQIANDTFTYSAGSNTYTYDGDDVSWTTATITARHGIIYDDTPGTSATKPLIVWQNYDTDQVSSGGTFTVQFNASGIFTITCA